MYFCYYSKGKKIIPDFLDTHLYTKNKPNEKPYHRHITDNAYLISETSDKSIFISENNIIITGRICIYNKSDILKDEIELDNEDISNETLILHLYNKYHSDFPNKINGDFSLIIMDCAKRSLFICRDHIGHFPLYFINYSDEIFVSSSIAKILPFSKSLEINPIWIEDMLSLKISDKHLTTYKNIFRFLPAHFYEIDATKFKSKRYWKPSYYKKGDHYSQNYIQEFKNLFENAVMQRCTDNNNGFELSGGIDSSSIACFAAKNINTGIYAFSHTIPEDARGKYKPFTDEMHHIEKIKNKFPFLNSFYVANPANSIIYDIKNNILTTKYLPQQQLQTFSVDLYKTVKNEKVKTLFSGFGGDEGLSSYGLFHIIDRLFNNRFLDIIKILLKRKHNRIGYIRLITRKWIDITLYKLGFNHNVSGIQNIEFLLHDQVSKEFIRITGKRTEEPKRENYYYLKLLEKINMDHVTSRLENCQVIADRYGFEYKYPMLDKVLLEYYLMLPPECHYTPQWPRNLIRQVASGTVPEDVLKRRDKNNGATIPNVPYRIISDYLEIKTYLLKYNRNSKICEYISIDKILQNLDNLIDDFKIMNKKSNQRYLINYLTILIFYDLYESGKLFDHNLNLSTTN